MQNYSLLAALALLLFVPTKTVGSKVGLSRLAHLEGEWAMLDDSGKATDLRASYRRAAGDSAVIETLFMDTPEETVTVYHVENKNLTLTQVSARSSPVRLKAVENGGVDALSFERAESSEVDGAVREIHLEFRSESELDLAWSVGPAQGPGYTRTTRWIRQDSVDELARRLSRLRVDLDSLQREIDGRHKRRVRSTSEKGKGQELLESRTVAGGPGWTENGVPLRRFLFDQVTEFASTYAAAGDAGLTVAHYPFVPGPDCHLSFSVLGGHAYVAVVEESKAPPRKIKSITEFSEDLLGGDYGLVVERISGKRWSDHAIAIHWDLSKFEGKPLRLYLVDAETDHYGQIAVSEVRITETASK